MYVIAQMTIIFPSLNIMTFFPLFKINDIFFLFLKIVTIFLSI